MGSSNLSNRWIDYFLVNEKETDNFWSQYFQKKRDVLFILGLGFDPRTSNALKRILIKHKKGKLKCSLIKYKLREIEDELLNKLINKNEEEVNSLLDKSEGELDHVIIDKSSDDVGAISFEVLYKFNSVEEFSKYTDIIVDISALPRSIYYPLLNKLCQIVDDRLEKQVNIHVVVTENPVLDSRIQERGLKEEASFIPTLSIKDIELTSDSKNVWIPILGEAQGKEIEKIYKFIDPIEVAPVLPFPAKNLRRGDNLIGDYRKELFGDVELSNIIYSDESNPFQTYRNLIRTFQRYEESFKIIGGCKIVVSALSSKLLSIGAFLAVYEAFKNDFQIGIAHVQALDYELKVEEKELPGILSENKMFSAWITGDPYNQSNQI